MFHVCPGKRQRKTGETHFHPREKKWTVVFLGAFSNGRSLVQEDIHFFCKQGTFWKESQEMERLSLSSVAICSCNFIEQPFSTKKVRFFSGNAPLCSSTSTKWQNCQELLFWNLCIRKKFILHFRVCIDATYERAGNVMHFRQHDSHSLATSARSLQMMALWTGWSRCFCFVSIVLV